jgi:hypothetical protein
LEIWSITGAFSSSQASTMAWMQFHVVDVERAQRVFAFQRLGKQSLVCVSGIIFGMVYR